MMKIAAALLLIGACLSAACALGPTRAPASVGAESPAAPVIADAPTDSLVLDTERVETAVSGGPASEQAKPPRAMAPGYTLTDSAKWGNLLDEGEMAVLRWRGAVIDTIDLGFGVAFTGRDSLVFQPVRFALDTVTHPGGETFILRDDTTDEFVLWTPAGRRQLREWLPHFDSHWSCAEFFAGALHYWGIVRGSDSLRRLYAMRYDFRSARLDSVYVRNDDFGTDYRYYLRIPRYVGDHIAYGRTLIDPRTWRIVRREDDPAIPPESP